MRIIQFMLNYYITNSVDLFYSKLGKTGHMSDMQLYNHYVYKLSSVVFYNTALLYI
jgi:hypothetical protein